MMNRKNTSEKDPVEKEHKTIMQVYAMFVAALMMGFIPSGFFALMALSMFLAVLIGAYVIRMRAGDQSLTADHMTYIIRTIWIVSFFALFTVAAGAAYLVPLLDYAAVEPCSAQLAGMISGGGTSGLTAGSLHSVMEGCYDNFISANLRHIIIATAIAAGPLVIYLGFRLAKGLSRARKNHRIGDVKSWF